MTLARTAEFVLQLQKAIKTPCICEEDTDGTFLTFLISLMWDRMTETTITQLIMS